MGLPLGSPLNPYDASLVAAFRGGLRKAGLIEGRDIILDIVWTAGNHAQAVAELVQRGAERSSSKGFLVGRLND
jgi:hypothetical protein